MNIHEHFNVNEHVEAIKELGKNEIKKRKKRIELLRSAYESFTTKGFNDTTILNIALNAGVAKGTFYLYFKNKEHIRNELIVLKSSQVLTDACNAMNDEVSRSDSQIKVADRIIFIVDYILDRLVEDPKLMHFVAKNLSWGLLFESTQFAQDNSDIIDIREFISDSFKRDGIKLRDAELLLFTIIELVSSTCYSTFQNEKPTSLADYKPYLHHVIRLIVEDAVISDVQ